MKAKNILAIGLSITGGAIFGILSAVAKLVQDDAYADLKNTLSELKNAEEKEEEEES